MQQQQLAAPELPLIGVPHGNMSIDELMEVTARLADILEEETRCLRDMKMDALAKLHTKKMELMLVIETYQKVLRDQPDFLKKQNAGKVEEFMALSEDLTEVVEENFRRTAVARAVNQRVMQTIVNTISEKQRPMTYNRYGSAMKKNDMPMPFNLNQKA